MIHIDRKHHSLPASCCRKGCPSQMTPTYQTSSLPEGERTELIREYTTMRLVHQGKDGTIKNALPLKKIHDQLELNSLSLQGSGSSNILLSTVSFDCLITDASGKERREYIHLNLRIPGANTKQEAVFTYDKVEKAYRGKQNLYNALQHFYMLGRSKANPENDPHGHQPAYDPTTSKHDQYIRHTEQLLAAYLALPESAEMLSNQLRTVIRAKDYRATSAKVYNMGLHMHSTKTCCAPCEYTLVGLMNEKQRFGTEEAGFLANFSSAATLPSETLTLTLPKKSGFRLLVTVSASETDAHHKKPPRYTKKEIGKLAAVPSYDISVKSQTAALQIFESMLNSGYNAKRPPPSPDLSEVTVAISGSRATPGSAETIRKVNQLREYTPSTSMAPTKTE